MIPYEKEVDIDNKLNNYLKIAGIINNVFRPQKILNVKRIKLYSTLPLPTLLCGSENWTITARNTRRITAIKMKCMEKTAGYIWMDYKINIEIAKELIIIPVLDKIQDNRRNFSKLKFIEWNLSCVTSLWVHQCYSPYLKKTESVIACSLAVFITTLLKTVIITELHFHWRWTWENLESILLAFALPTTHLTWRYSGLNLRPHDEEPASFQSLSYIVASMQFSLSKLAFSLHILIYDHLCKVICTHQASLCWLLYTLVVCYKPQKETGLFMLFYFFFPVLTIADTDIHFKFVSNLWEVLSFFETCKVKMPFLSVIPTTRCIQQNAKLEVLWKWRWKSSGMWVHVIWQSLWLLCAGYMAGIIVRNYVHGAVGSQRKDHLNLNTGRTCAILQLESRDSAFWDSKCHSNLNRK